MKILLVVDVYGWAFDFAARGIQKYSKHECNIKRWTEVSEEDIDIKDVAFFFNDSCFNVMSEKLRKMFDGAGREEKIKLCLGVRGEENPSDRIMPGWNIGCVNEGVYNVLKRKNIPKTFLTRNGVDTEIFKPLQPKKSFFVGWVGNTEQPLKRSFLLTKLAYPVNVQSNWGEQYFKKDRSRTEMTDFYKSIDVLISVSRHEGMPQPILEAAACGLPIIATAVGGIPEFVDEEWLVPAEPEELVIKEMNEKLHFLKNNPEVRLAVGKRNLEKTLKEWSWIKRVEEYDRMFEG